MIWFCYGWRERNYPSQHKGLCLDRRRNRCRIGATVDLWQPLRSLTGRWGQRRGQHPWQLLLGWLIMLPERMCARRASSSGEAGGPTIVAAHGPVVAGSNAGTRITTRDVNPTPPAAFTLNSAKASTVLLRCCRARVCKGYNREKADGQQITHCICPSVDGFHPVGEPQPMRISQGQSGEPT